MAASQPKKLTDILRIIKNEVPQNVISTPISHDTDSDGRVIEAVRFVETSILDPLGPNLDYKLREKPSDDYNFIRRQIENYGVAP